MGRPMISWGSYPKIRVAAAFQERIWPSSVLLTIASSDDSTMAANSAGPAESMSGGGASAAGEGSDMKGGCHVTQLRVDSSGTDGYVATLLLRGFAPKGRAARLNVGFVRHGGALIGIPSGSGRGGDYAASSDRPRRRQ